MTLKYQCLLILVFLFLLQADKPVLQGQGGSECDFLPTMSPDSHVTFESVTALGSHIGVLPSGQLTSPAQTNKMTDASHFRIKYLVRLYSIIVERRSIYFVVMSALSGHALVSHPGF